MKRRQFKARIYQLRRLARQRAIRRQSLLWLLAAGIATATLASISDRAGIGDNGLAAMSFSGAGSSVLVLTNPDGSISEHALKTGLPLAMGSITSQPSSTTPETVRIQRGDTLVSALKRHGVHTGDLNQLATAHTKAFRRLRPGQRIRLRLDQDRHIRQLSLQLNLHDRLTLTATDSGFSSRVDSTVLERRPAYATGVITDSLYQSGQRAGLGDRHVAQMVEMFGWDIDFALDVRNGDRFTVVYEDLYRDGIRIGAGNIIAAEYINRGVRYRAIAHKDEHGRTQYYSPDGKSLRRSFLRTPVKFSRISSRFTHKRYHPVLKRWRAHKGVDYAAPTGTPIRTTANGTVVFAGRKGGYGKTVIIRHGGRFSTLYAHMSRIKVHKGTVVRQGQVIGKVGSTGLASGPHLHYEFRVNDQHRNPLTYQFPAASPIHPALRNRFQQVAEKRVAQLDALAGTTRLASTR